MNKQLICMIFIIIWDINTQFEYAQNQSYLTNQELQKLMPDFQRQVEYWNQYEEPKRQSEARAFAKAWSGDRTVAPFLGRWAAIEETMDIYPSTTRSQVCIISAFSTPNPEVDFNLGNIRNQRIYTDGGGVIIQQGNYVGIAGRNGNKASVYVYRLIAPAEVPTRASLNDWRGSDRLMEQFNAAGCIAEASKRNSSRLDDREVEKRAVILFHDVIIK